MQVGTAFEFANESGLRDDYKEALMEMVIAGTSRVFTDPLASPTGFPFKVAELKGTCSDEDVYEARPRICDLGFLREPYRTEDGGIGYRCAGEPLSVYVAKGGKAEDTAGRKCVCNGLLSNIGYQQVRNGKREEYGLITAGDDLYTVKEFLKPGRTEYDAAEVISRLLTGCDDAHKPEQSEEVCFA